MDTIHWMYAWHAHAQCLPVCSQEAALTEELAAAHEGAAAAQAAHTAEATQLRQGVDAAQARAQALGAEKEEAALALAGLQEEQDTMREELEFTRGKMAELEAGLAAAQAERERADRCAFCTVLCGVCDCWVGG